jgi:hypothetical protein
VPGGTGLVVTDGDVPMRRRAARTRRVEVEMRADRMIWSVSTIALCVAAVPAMARVVAPPLRAPQGGAAGGHGPYTPPTCVPGVPSADITCSTGFDPWIEQFGLDGITAGCGGSNYCPGSPVTRDQMAVFVEKAMRGTASWPAHTQLVWAVRNADGTPNPGASGAALHAAMTAIPTSGNDLPSSSNPWLVKVGPGVFDLGGQGIGLPAYVNLDGAGQNSTTITDSSDFGDVLNLGAGANTASNVSLSNVNGATTTYVIYATGTTLTLDHVFVEAFGGSSFTNAVYSNGSNLSIYDGTIVASGGGNAIGIYTDGGSAFSSQVWRTLFSCGTADVYNNAGHTIDLAYTRAPDALNNFGTGVFHCIGNYGYTLASVSCP